MLLLRLWLDSHQHGHSIVVLVSMWQFHPCRSVLFRYRHTHSHIASRPHLLAYSALLSSVADSPCLARARVELALAGFYTVLTRSLLKDLLAAFAVLSIQYPARSPNRVVTPTPPRHIALLRAP